MSFRDNNAQIMLTDLVWETGDDTQNVDNTAGVFPMFSLKGGSGKTPLPITATAVFSLGRDC